MMVQSTEKANEQSVVKINYDKHCSLKLNLRIFLIIFFFSIFRFILEIRDASFIFPWGGGGTRIPVLYTCVTRGFQNRPQS